MIAEKLRGKSVKYLNTRDNEEFLISKGFRLPSEAPEDRFETYKYMYGGGDGMIRGIKEDSGGALVSMPLAELV